MSGETITGKDVPLPDFVKDLPDHRKTIVVTTGTGQGK